MALRTFLSILAAFAFLAAQPLGAWSDEAQAECASSAAGLHAGCCGQGEKPDCGVACPAMQAVVKDETHRFPLLVGGSPLQCAATSLALFAAPPDTAPPKPRYA